jgi:hypothetical protein
MHLGKIINVINPAVFLIIITSNVINGQQIGGWFAIDTLKEKIVGHASVKLSNGNILIAGGYRHISGTSETIETNTTEILDINTFNWNYGPSMNIGRVYHNLVKLNDGSILAIGGFNESSTELLDKYYLQWKFVDNIKRKRWRGQTATLMQDGNVLLVGGGTDYSANDSAETLRECEIYDHKDKRWLTTSELNIGRSDHTATLLKDGRILVAGGSNIKYGGLKSCEIYDPNSKNWSFADSMHSYRSKHSAVLLNDGKVLVIGGGSKEIELYDPIKDKWEIVGTINLTTYDESQAVTLSNEKYLLLVSSSSAYAGWELLSLERFESIYYEQFKRNITHQVVTKIDENKVLTSGGIEYVTFWDPVAVIINFSHIYDITLTNIEEESDSYNIPSQFTISCYPNPFNNSTRINIELNYFDRISLDVYNVLGEKISTIYNGELNAGIHSFRFNANDYPSGIYFVRASNEKHAKLIKIIHQK